MNTNYEEIKKRLEAILAPGSFLYKEEEIIAFECDALTYYRVRPVFVVLPETTEQVSEIIKVCFEFDMPFVPRGAGTGLSGGALPVDDGVLISLAKMNKILEIDIPNRLVVAQPGVINRSVSEAVDGFGFYYAPDPSSQIVCTIGGNVAENSGGVHCLKYGVTTNHILGLEMVLPNGERVELGGKNQEYPGYDLLSIVVGSEGLLGIVTKVFLKISKKPQLVKTLFASFDNIEDAGSSVSGIISSGIIPAGMEIMDNTCIRAVQTSVKAGYPEDADSILLIELDGPTAEVEAQLPIVENVLRENSAIQIKIAKDEAERELLWKGRKSAFAAMGRVSPDYYVQDGVIPRNKLAVVLKKIKQLSEQYGLTIANVFHAGDGNLHPLILFNSAVEGEFEKVERLAGEILRICVESGGSITGEHGVGFDKKSYIPLMFNEQDLNTMQLISCTFDTKGLCNPGKLFPTPRTCAEHGMTKERATELERKVEGELF